MYYGDKRESLVNICHTLMELGWKIYGYKPDQSDLMTDYYDPASWDGVATKNGYVLCVDVNGYTSSYSEREIFKYNRPTYTFKATAKIEQLNRLVNDRAATEGEKRAALAAIERIKESARLAEEKAETEKVLIEKWPKFQQNPPHCNWHIEKNGVVVAKGRGAFQFHNLPYWVDPMTELPKDTWRAWELDEDQKKDLAKFQTFIKKIEGIVSVKIGDGNGDDEYRTITATEYKTELKAKEVSIGNLDEELEPGMSFKLLSNFNYGCLKGYVYKIKDDTKGRISAVRLNGKLTKELTGRATDANRFSCSYEKFKKWVEIGAISMCEIVEVKTPYKVEKCVKVGKRVNKNVTTERTTQDSMLESYDFEIIQDVDTRDNSTIFVVKVKNKVDDFNALRIEMRKIQGYYSRFKHGFIFKSDPSELLNNFSIEAKPSAEAEKADPSKPSSEQVAQRKIKTVERIEKQIKSIQSKIQSLSGNYKTNTYKRIREQEGRDLKIRAYRLDLDILNYLLNIIDDRELTKLETALITDAFRTVIDDYYNRYIAYNNPNRYSAAMPIKYPEISETAAEWYNADVPKQQKRLNKAGIYSTNDLIKAVEEYSKIIETALKPVDQTQLRIKKLERECVMMQKGDINFTPIEVASRLVELANIDCNSKVLEPSAGIARIADEISKITNNIDVVERMASFRELLTLKGYNLVGDDFMEYNEGQIYDAIIANPPFSDEQAHIKHMYELLKPGGRLVTICSPHWTFANDKKSLEFRGWVEDLASYTTDLPSGTFEMTGVATKILVIEKADTDMAASA